MAPKGQATKAPAKQESLGAALARRARAQIRFLIALAVGVAVALLAPFDERIPRVLAGWNAGGWLYLVLVAIKMWRAEIDGISYRKPDGTLNTQRLRFDAIRHMVGGRT